ncbi:sensor histidine kinase [Poseidonibacter antarcticus]|uniref:sensor histidine kinase n=1 Tax=Poseidonibacter antarcticus TaxID=2478538 RepID=UPI001D17DA1C|nr:ATP-binding protein [Poseidonibacter antarcticus]
MNKLSIKKKLLIYVFFIQVFILIIFSISLHKALEISTIDKLESTLKVITLDIVDDILEKDNFEDLNFDEEKEYKFEPLYIRFIKLDKKINIIKNISFPEEIKSDISKLNLYNKDIIIFDEQDPYLISRLKFIINNESYVLEVATNDINLNNTLENFLYILVFIIPIILIFATIGGYFIIYKSFYPIEQIVQNLKEINSKNLSKRLERLENNDEIDNLSKEINNLLNRLEISFEKVTQFTSDASHELKTPLTIIRGELEIALRKDRSTNEYKDTLNTSLEEVLLIQQTIEDLLFLAKTKDKLEYIENEIYLDEITLQAGKELEKFAKLKKVDIKYDILEPFQINGHSQLLKIALKNIIKNAIIFSYENSSIYIKNYRNNDYYIISVKDNGIGIAKDEQKKIFEKFYRTDKSRSKDSGGTGLGMSISKKIMQIHNSIIILESIENSGTTVFLKFPI